MNQKNTTFQIIQRLAQKVGRKFHPAKIILFGSHAKGFANAQSDVDLLVIIKEEKYITQRYGTISKELEPRPFPIDLLVRSSVDIQKRLKMGDCFIADIVANGKVLYES